MRILVLVFALTTLSCARGKMGYVDKHLAAGDIPKGTQIYVEAIKADKVIFTGDKADDQQRLKEERQIIESRYHRLIASQLQKKGFKATAVDSVQRTGVVISGSVSRFQHGSGAARFLVGMGAGSSNMYTDFVIEDRTKKTQLSKFEVIATSGGRSGLESMGGFLDAHLEDGAEKVSEFINGETK